MALGTCFWVFGWAVAGRLSMFLSILSISMYMATIYIRVSVQIYHDRMSLLFHIHNNLTISRPPVKTNYTRIFSSLSEK